MLEKLSVCCGDLWSLEISDGTVMACSSELCVSVVSKSIIESKTLSIVTLKHVTVFSYQIYNSSYAIITKFSQLSESLQNKELF
jgi:hypothetical protein